MQRAVCSVFKCCKVDVLLEQPFLLAQISLAVEPASTTLCLMVVKVVEKVGRPTETDVVANYGLSAIFHPGDLRCQTAAGLWPSSDLRENPLSLTTALNKSKGILVADTYGGVEAYRWARDAYNATLSVCC